MFPFFLGDSVSKCRSNEYIEQSLLKGKYYNEINVIKIYSLKWSPSGQGNFAEHILGVIIILYNTTYVILLG